ncbi:hypothetical protein MINTMi198_17600 [Mycobacterium intracellulare M.i.198]|uniref:hypothetical protein n=1 Tax=Mycobacterium intracellulare TaxID=1767 RepID=UPI0011D1A1A7|nr:hypothetical protein [Mycobacterium intracellulare]BCP36390.1 hypothetical protein MINTMi198_17600 [Mycobacterium intracellulare M.i.198]
MPLQVMAQALNLPDAVTRLNEPGWAFAQTVNLGTSQGLIMWRIPLVRDTDPMYAPVAALMERSEVEVLFSGEVVDPGVIGGKLEAFVALLHPEGQRQTPSPQQRTFVDIFENWGETVLPEHLPEKMAHMCALHTH